jgi:penicillin-binding protein 2
MKDRLRPLSNRSIQGQYPPGSTFKVIMAIAGLEEGVLQPESRISDPGYYFFGNRQFRDWKKGGHGSVDLHRAIVESRDVYFTRRASGSEWIESRNGLGPSAWERRAGLLR